MTTQTTVARSPLATGNEVSLFHTVPSRVHVWPNDDTELSLPWLCCYSSIYTLHTTLLMNNQYINITHSHGSARVF